jgi:cardiolipin synthase
MVLFDTILIVGAYLYLGVTILFLLLDNRDPSTTLAWLLVFILFPFGGLILYFMFGRGMRKKSKKMLLRQNLEDRLLPLYEKLVKQQQEEMRVIFEKCQSAEKRKLMKLLFKNSDSVLTRHNELSLFFNGEKKFSALLTDLKSAERCIYMEYFIWKVDPLTDRVVEILAEKAKAGVDVRILYDIGGHYLSPFYLKRLRAMGIRIYPYYNFLAPFKIHTLNYRNHRKIVVIDGRIGYVGGMNMGAEYITGGKRFPMWRDTHMRIEGEVVTVLSGIFSVAWANTTREKIDLPQVSPPRNKKLKDIPIQVTASGPDSEWKSIKQLYFLLITSAERSISIETPYFIPDATILMALRTAALSGVDVKIILSGYVDKRLPYWAARTYLKDLLKAGVRFFYYTKGFMHAKTIVIDEEICSIGTANFDIRSFDINYEINALVYDGQTTKQLSSQFSEDLRNSHEFALADYYAMPKIVQLRNSLMRLFSPLM